ncbi:hypothetical protein [Halorubrum laminariae]|uniref:Tat pathway signal protein n=1 Tax=Halorubrum laminariae TaxID=1433523 RepID=A0ABD6C2L8_9EURY|nr:hypothetical protein [Halorubrum laminariae]
MHERTPSRRRVLAGGVAAVLGATAGCLGGALRSDDADADGDDRVLRLTFDDAGETLRDRFVDDPTETDTTWDTAAFAAVRDGETYTTQYRKPFFSTTDDPRYAVHGGTYYRLGSVVVDEAEATRPVLRLFDADADGNGVDSGDDADSTGDSETARVVDAETLPSGDRRAVEIAHFAARARGNEGGIPIGLVERGGYVYRRPDALDASGVLADDGPDRVRFRDTVYRIDVAREQFYEPVYRATGTVVAESPEQVEAILRARKVDARIAEGDLSPDAQEVIETAEHGEYEESYPYSEGYAAVLRALHERPYLDGDIESDATATDSGAGMVRHAGRYYDYRLRFEPNS